MNVSPGDRAVQLAGKLLQLGLTHAAVAEMLSFPLDDLEAQLNWLPYRKAKRPGAFLINAVRRNYSPPKEFYYANLKAIRNHQNDAVDPDAKRRY